MMSRDVSIYWQKQQDPGEVAHPSYAWHEARKDSLSRRSGFAHQLAECKRSLQPRELSSGAPQGDSVAVIC